MDYFMISGNNINESNKEILYANTSI